MPLNQCGMLAGIPIKMNESSLIYCLIEYSGVGVAVFILLLTNPEVWRTERTRCLPRWFVSVPFFFLIGLISLLLIHVLPNKKEMLLDLGWFSIAAGTIILLLSYIVFSLISMAPYQLSNLITLGGRFLGKIRASLDKEAERLKVMDRKDNGDT